MYVIYLTENYGIFVWSECYTENYEHRLEKIPTRTTKASHKSPSLEREAVIENHSVLSSERIPLLKANWISAM